MLMAKEVMNRVVERLRGIACREEIAGPGDGRLLSAFLHGDERAFELIVRRHGPMVMGVCRRILTDWNDADDAFQAAFLVLVRKARTLASPDLLANWLFGVAYNTAIKARAWAARRRRRERQMSTIPDTVGPDTDAIGRDSWDELLPLLDRELSLLPDKYRAPIVLCDLEGKTQKEAARHVGCPEGTLSARLSRGRQMLAHRLRRRGAMLTGGSLAVLLSQNALAGPVASGVVGSTVKAAVFVAAGHAATPGVISAKVAALTEGVVKSMLLTKCKLALGVMLVVCGLSLMAFQTFLQARAQEPDAVRQAPAQSQAATPQAAPGDDAAKKEDRPLLPMGPAPVQALVSLEQGQLVVRSFELAGFGMDMKKAT